jgi:DNA-3-methyladenine glycosylase I|tara:strand:+ start:16562 stop:17101 length:540 start_codon:yes stop_codon:yes gene_type:complete
MSYCDYCAGKEDGDLNKIYHDTAYGFPIANDNELFGRLILEINQAGLSWSLMLKKENNFRLAFDNFNIERISNYDDVKISELLENSGIIRNRLKINSVIYNAQKIISIQKEFGTFANWLDSQNPLSKEEWTKLFKKTFKFTGGEIVNEFLMSTGYLKGAHDESCTIFDKILEHNPKWKI